MLADQRQRLSSVDIYVYTYCWLFWVPDNEAQKYLLIQKYSLFFLTFIIINNNFTITVKTELGIYGAPQTELHSLQFGLSQERSSSNRGYSQLRVNTPHCMEKNLDSDHIALLLFTPGTSSICGHARLPESTKPALVSASRVSDSGRDKCCLFFFLRFTYFCFMCLRIGLCMPEAHRFLKRALNPLELKSHSCELTRVLRT